MPNVLALGAQTVLTMLITLAQVKILANFLTRENFGLFASLRGLSLLLAMLGAAGLPQLLVRFIPIHESRGDARAALRLSAICVAGAAGLLAVLCAGTYVARRHLLAFAGVDAIDDLVLVWLVATTFGVGLKMVVYGGINGLRRFTVQMIIETTGLAMILVAVAVMREHLTLLLLFQIMGAVQLATLAVSGVVYFVLLGREAGQRVDGAGAVPVSEYRDYLLWATVLAVVALAFTDVDRYLLAHFLTLEALALFHIASRISRLANRLLGVPLLALQPEVTRLDAEARSERVTTSTLIYVKFNSIMAVIMVLFITTFARELIIIVASRDYLSAVPVLLVLTLSLPFTTVTAPMTTVMKARDQVRGALGVDLAWAVSYVGLIFALAPVLGVMGVALATLSAGVVQLFVALRVSRLPIGAEFAAALLSRLVIAGVVAFLPVGLVMALGGGIGYGWAAAKTVLFILGCVAFMRIVRGMRTFSPAERAQLIAALEDKGLRAVRGLI